MKIYVGNLAWTVDEEKLKELFSAYTVTEAVLIKDKFSGRSKGFGFVTIEDDANAQKAIEELNGKDVEGRELKLSEAKPMEDRPPRKSFGGNRNSSGSRSFGGNNRNGGNRNFNRR